MNIAVEEPASSPSNLLPGVLTPVYPSEIRANCGPRLLTQIETVMGGWPKGVGRFLLISCDHNFVRPTQARLAKVVTTDKTISMLLPSVPAAWALVPYLRDYLHNANDQGRRFDGLFLHTDGLLFKTADLANRLTERNELFKQFHELLKEYGAFGFIGMPELL